MDSQQKELPVAFSSLPLFSFNHVSFLCRSVNESTKFYEDVLGFVLIKRPPSLDFEGAWLFNYGVGIHLLQCNCPMNTHREPGVINPKDNHISFQCSDIGLVKQKLEEMGMEYVTGVVEEGAVRIDQVFFHDPDGYMIEICNCENLPLHHSSCPTAHLFSANCSKARRSAASKDKCGCCGFQTYTKMMEPFTNDTRPR